LQDTSKVENYYIHIINVEVTDSGQDELSQVATSFIILTRFLHLAVQDERLVLSPIDSRQGAVGFWRIL